MRQRTRRLVAHRGLLAAALVAALVAVAACGGGGGSSTARQVAGGDASRGKRAIQGYGCGSCHFIPGVANAHGYAGPPLIQFARRGYIAGVLENTPENLMQWLRDPQSVVPGNDMPNLHVSEDDARNIAAYLYSLK